MVKLSIKIQNKTTCSIVMDSLSETFDDEAVFLSCTQDTEDVDVAWDWNSPRRKFKRKKRTVREQQPSPKLVLKRHPSNSQVPIFDKLKEQIAELQKEVIGCGSKDVFDDSIFDDSIEKELVLCSQKIEQQLKNIPNGATLTVDDNLADDSFDLVLQQLDDDKLEELTQRAPMIVKSCDSSFVEELSPVKCSPEEIEQKRLQALEKLQAKKKQQIIEKNRREALKRLEMSRKKKTNSNVSLPRKLSTNIN